MAGVYIMEKISADVIWGKNIWKGQEKKVENVEEKGKKKEERGKKIRKEEAKGKNKCKIGKN